MRKFFKAYGQDPEDLVFYLKNQNEKKDDEQIGALAAQRRKYWELALAEIKEAHGPDGSFRNVNPKTNYWINGWFGIGGFSLSCCARLNQVSAGIDLAKGDRDKNKAAFDYLYARKDEIEKAMGAPLNWFRFEGKASYVSYYLGMGIEDESAKTPRIEVAYKVGDRVRIKDDSFDDSEGIVDSIDVQNNTVRVIVQMFGQDTPVDLELNKVEVLE